MSQPIVIVGAGAAGVGLGLLLKRLELPFVIIDQSGVGASFERWCQETQFISPSFTGNAFGLVDLNAISPDTSPAFTLKTEHPTGLGYAKYLKDVVAHFKLPVIAGVQVDRVEHHESDHTYTLHTSDGEINTQYVIWAAGEFGYPSRDAFEGAPLCTHYADLDSWKDLSGDEFAIIGGYESGVDAAYQLAKLGKHVTLFDGGNHQNKHSSDSSYALSPFTRDRFAGVEHLVDVVHARIDRVTQVEDGYMLQAQDGQLFKTPQLPINCTGFTSSLMLVKDLFHFDEGVPLLNEFDESTKTPNFFLAGPQVRHGSAIFCFIYKYRQRFGVVGHTLSERLGGDEVVRDKVLEYYRNAQFYMDDLACCDDECAC